MIFIKQELNNAYDRTQELTSEQLKEVLPKFTNNIDAIYIVTPIDKNKQPDLTPLIKASETVGKILKKVIYESTVYPGATEEECVPVLEKFSGLKYISTQTIHQSQITNHQKPMASIAVTHLKELTQVIKNIQLQKYLKYT